RSGSIALGSGALDVRYAPDSGAKVDIAGGPSWANKRHDGYDFRLASGFATSRAVSMKSCATGLSVRFFRVTIPIGTRAYCSLTGKTLISGRLENLNIEIGMIVRKRPVATRLSRTPARAANTAVRG